MTKRKVAQKSPKIIQARRYVFNQGAVYASHHRRVARAFNAIQAFNTKPFLAFTEDLLAELLDTGGPPATGSGTTKMRHFRVRTSPQTKQLRFRLGLIPTNDDLDSMTNPRARARVLLPNEAESDDQLTGAVGMPVETSAFGGTPENISWGEVGIDVDPETEYVGWLELLDGQRIISGIGYELAGSPIDDALDGGIDPRPYVDEGPILTSDFEDLVHANNTLPDAQGAPLIAWAGPDENRVPSLPAGTPANIFDDSLTSVSSTSPGFRVDLTNRGDVNGDVRVRAAIRARSRAATPPFENTARLVDINDGALATLEDYDPSGSSGNDHGWQHQDITLEAKEYKIDAQAEDVHVDAVMLYPHPHT